MADPEKLRLQAALRQIQFLTEEYANVLNPSCHLAEDKTWMGPAGEQFTDQVHDARREVRGQLTQAYEDAKRALDRLEGH
jgi:hypothetical protein